MRGDQGGVTLSERGGLRGGDNVDCAHEDDDECLAALRVHSLIALLPRLHENGTTVTVAARHAGITKQAVGKLVGELVQLGYVERRAHPDDMRAALVVFTERGEGLLRDIAKTINGIERCYAEAMGTSGFEHLRSLLGKLRAAVPAPT